MSFAKAAVSFEKKYDIPAEITVAQWALESGWGEHQSGSNNYFGIKKASRHVSSTEVLTREVYSDAGIDAMKPEEKMKIARNEEGGLRISARADKQWDVWIYKDFADFPSVEASLEDRLWVLSTSHIYRPYYTRWQKSGAPEDFIAMLARWATDPNYIPIISKISTQEDVKHACEEARSAAV